MFYTCFVRALYILYRCFRHVLDMFKTKGGSKIKFFQKVCGAFGLSFGIIGGVRDEVLKSKKYMFFSKKIMSFKTM